MKKFFSTLFIAGLALPALAGEPAPLPSDFDYNTVATHFTGCLQSQVADMYAPTTYVSDYTVSHDDVATTIARIWEEWKKSNSNFSEDGLRSTSSTLKSFPNGRYKYTIPQSLEPYVTEPDDPDKYPGPDAQMQYYFGYKYTGPRDPKMPLFIYLHGSGGIAPSPYDPNDKGEINSALEVCNGSGSDDTANGIKGTYGLYMVPRIPNAWNTYYRWFHKSKQWVWEKILRQAFLRTYIDTDRIYFMGASEGAYGSQRLASFYADYLGGAGPMAGGEPLINAPAENLYNTYFSIITGEIDTAFDRAGLTRYVGEWLDRLQKEHPDGYEHECTIVPGAPHVLKFNGHNYYLDSAPRLVKHSRVTNPKHVRWENYAMDGRYRSGFYNLKVIQRSELNPSNELERTYYEMDIDGNNIDMKVSVVNITVDEWYPSGGVALKIHKDYTPATQGRFKIYLGDKLVDLSKEVVLTVNGRELYRGVLQPNLADMVNSCAEYYDPERVYPASIDVDLATMTGSALTSGIEDIIADLDPDAPVEYYTLQGIRIATPTTPGIYILRQGNAARKIYLR